MAAVGYAEDPWMRAGYGAAPAPIYAQVSPSMYNPYAVAPIQPLPTQRSVAGSVSPPAPEIPKAHDLEGQPTARTGGQPTSRTGPPTARTEPGTRDLGGPSSSDSGEKINLLPAYAALCLILFVTIPTLGLASYAVDKVNNEFMTGAGTSAAMYPIAQNNFAAWNGALQTKDYEKVAALYSSSELSFLPTVSPDFIRDMEGAKGYFKDFLKKDPFGTITSDNVQAFGTDAYLHTGMYTFLLGPADARTPVEARFSYMWKKSGDNWKITHHHSSVKPSASRRALTEAERALNFEIVSADPELVIAPTQL